MATQGKNTVTFEELLQVAKDLGAQSGNGKDTQIKFALKVVDGGYQGALDLTPNKHGDGLRDGVVLAEAYVKAQNATVIFDAHADNQRKLISNLDKCIKLGSTSKWGVGEPISTVNSLMTIRQKIKSEGKVKVIDAFNSLMKYATAQLKLDRLMDDSELRAFVIKPDQEAKSAEDILEAIRKQARKLAEGKVAHCPDMDNGSEVQSIIRMCTKRLTAIAKARAAQEGDGSEGDSGDDEGTTPQAQNVAPVEPQPAKAEATNGNESVETAALTVEAGAVSTAPVAVPEASLLS